MGLILKQFLLALDNHKFKIYHNYHEKKIPIYYIINVKMIVKNFVS